jgi:hypothetical protein
MYSELTLLYSNYIKYYANFKARSSVLSLRMSEVSVKAKHYTVEELLSNYENFDGLIQQVFNFYQHQNFCKRTRLYQNVVFLMY